MKLTDDMKSVVQGAPYCTLITVNADGSPHPIIVGGKELAGDDISIGIYKMEQTQKNLAANPRAWVTIATVDGGPKGFRFEGTATAKDGKLVFAPASAQAMI